MTKEQPPGQRMIASAKEALAFAQGENNDCIVHIPDKIDAARIRQKINISQSQNSEHARTRVFMALNTRVRAFFMKKI